MGEHHEVRHERLYLKEPGTERLRKGSDARLRYLLAKGWKETERWHASDYITVRVVRSGVAPRMTRMPKIEAPPPRPPRQGFGQNRFGGAGGGRGPAPGPGGGRGPGAGSRGVGGGRAGPASGTPTPS